MTPMKKIAVFTLLLASAVALWAADLTGTWNAAVDLGGVGSGTATFTFQQDGEKLTGTYAGTFGQAPLKGTLKGNAAEWTFDADQVGAISYKGVVDGNKMKGSVQYGGAGSGTFTAEKK